MTRYASALRLLLLSASLVPLAAAAPSAEIDWRAPIEIAAGGEQKGPWQQNESLYNYVDDPTVAIGASGAVGVAWVDQRAKDVFFRVYAPDGEARSTRAANVSRSPRTFSWLPRVAFSVARPDEVYVLWQEIIFSGGSHGGDILFARSGDGGQRFDAPLNLSSSTAGDGKGRITREIWHNGSLDVALAPDGPLYLAWTEYEGALWFRRSTDGGRTFSEAIRIAGTPSRPARAPALVAGPRGAVYLAWTVGEDPTADIHFAQSSDGGRHFEPPQVVERTAGYSDAPRLALDAQGTLHLVFAESAGGPFERYHLRYTRREDGDERFARTRNISGSLPEGAQSVSFPGLELGAPGTVYVLAELFPNAREQPQGLGLLYSLDGGNHFANLEAVPGSRGARGASNGSHQGLLMRKLAADRSRRIAIVNSALLRGEHSRVWLISARHRSSGR